MLNRGGSFEFGGLFDPTALLDKARIEGAALESIEILDLLAVAERIAAWRNLLNPPPTATRYEWPGIAELSSPLLDHELAPLLRLLRGKIEPDGSLNDDASPELRRIRRAMERQHRSIEESLRKSLRGLSEGGSTQDELITIRGDRFVIPVKAEFKRKVPGVIHGSSSSGQTVFIEPLETIEHNNELVRLLDEEQSEIHRILVAMTRALGENAVAIHLGTCILAEVGIHFARARFAIALNCVQPIFTQELSLIAARHPLLELRMSRRGSGGTGTAEGPGSDSLCAPRKQNNSSSAGRTGRQNRRAEDRRPALSYGPIRHPGSSQEAKLPLFTSVFADIGDAQSIERNLSSFSAHVINLDRITREATPESLVLLDELARPRIQRRAQPLLWRSPVVSLPSTRGAALPRT